MIFSSTTPNYITFSLENAYLKKGILMKLSDSKASNVWRIFYEISKVPRPSKQEQQIIAWLEKFAADNGLKWRKDKAGNIVMEVPATKGRENQPIIVLQSHMDMVCQKTPDSTHDFMKDPLKLIEQDGWVTADKTTLGADDGIGMALSLAVATASPEELPHGPIELLFTVDEETGLTGVCALSSDFIKGRQLINIDSEDEGTFIVGCAGGLQTQIELPLQTETPGSDFVPARIAVGGLTGGHSGVNINENRANAIKMLAYCLQRISSELPGSIKLVRLKGGNAHNAIPRDANAMIYIKSTMMDKTQQLLQQLQSQLRNNLTATDPDITLTMTEQQPETTTNTSVLAPTLTTDAAKKALNLITALPNGVYRYCRDFHGIVETSSNLAEADTIINSNNDENKYRLQLLISQRSSVSANLDEINRIILAVTELAGANYENSGSYPAWQPAIDSPLLKKFSQAYQQLFDKQPRVTVIHAGLECSIIGAKYKPIDMISIGPTMQNPHSPQERVNIDSVDKVWQLLVQVLTSNAE